MMIRADLNYDSNSSNMLFQCTLLWIGKHLRSLFIKDKNEYCHDKVTQVYLKIKVW